MKLIFFTLVLIATLDRPSDCFAQQPTNWFEGDWIGERLAPNSHCFQRFELVLRIDQVKGNTFEGTATGIVSDNRSLSNTYAVGGRIYSNRISLLFKGLIQASPLPPGCNWVDCSFCDSSVLAFEISKDKFVISVTKECSWSVCNGTDRYSRDLNEFSDEAIKSLEKMIYKTENTSLINDFEAYKNRTISEKTSSQALSTPILTQKKDTLQHHSKTLKEFRSRIVETIKTLIIEEDSIELRLFDNCTIDRDSVTIIYNGEIIAERYCLSLKPFIKKLPLEKDRTNQIILFAENLGEIPPNTALLKILYNDQQIAIYPTSDFKKSAAVELIVPPASNPYNQLLQTK